MKFDRSSFTLTRSMPLQATGNLSCRGLHRALLLPRVITGKFKQLSNVYVPTVGSDKSTVERYGWLVEGRPWG